MAAAVAVPVDALGSAHGTVGALAAPAAPPLNTLTTPAAPPLNTLTTPTTQSTSSQSTPAALFAESDADGSDELNQAEFREAVTMMGYGKIATWSRWLSNHRPLGCALVLGCLRRSL